MVTIFGAVLDQTLPGKSGFDRFPKVCKGLFGHVAVAHNIVRRSDQFVVCKAANIHKGFVGELDASTRICPRDENIIVIHQDFAIGYRTIITHYFPLNLLPRQFTKSPEARQQSPLGKAKSFIVMVCKACLRLCFGLCLGSRRPFQVTVV